MKLTPHFSLAEFTDSPTALRKGISNLPNDSAIGNLQRVADTLELVRALFDRPLVISSGYRSSALNAAVGGSKNSAHLTGLAVDFTVPGILPSEVAKAIAKSNISFDQVVHEGSWTHLGLSAGVPRREVLTAHFGGGPATYTRGIA